MKAATYSRVGRASEVIEFKDLPCPDLGPDDVLVEVHTSGINAADVKRRGGWNGGSMAHSIVIPHSDGAGVIVKVGADVNAARLGERVWIWNGQGSYGEAGRAFGTAAEYIVLPSQQAVALPDSLTFDQGACLGIPAMTAYQSVYCALPLTGRTVLINGAAGSVGALAVQFAVHAGATVIGTVGDPTTAERVLQLGASSAINRRSEVVRDRVLELTNGEGVDHIVEVDFAANLTLDAAVLKRNGSIASYSSSSNTSPVFPYYDLAIKGARLMLIQSFHLPASVRRAGEAKIQEMANAGTLKVDVARSHPFSELALAHERIESGLSGNVVVRVR